MLEEKARKAAAETEQIIRRRKKITPVRFKRRSVLLANQLISAQQAMEEYETVSETGDSPPKNTTVARNFGGAKPKSNFQLITQQQNYGKQEIARDSFDNQTKAWNTDSANRNPITSSPKEGNATMTLQKLSRQIGEKTSENSVEDETNVRLSPVSGINTEDNSGHVASNPSNIVGISRSKRIPKANKTEKYGAIMLRL